MTTFSQHLPVGPSFFSDRLDRFDHYLQMRCPINIKIPSSLRHAGTSSFSTQRPLKMVRAPFIDKNGVKKGAWSVDEDRKLKAYIEKYGHWNWRELPRFAGLPRCGKSCRLRWMNYLRPDVKRGSYSKEEENLIIRLHKKHGNKWSTIAANLPGRTDNEIKNHWHTHLKKRFQPSSTAVERSQESETSDHDQINSNGSGPRSEKEAILTVPCSSPKSFSSSSMYQILESSSISSEATSYQTTSMTEDTLSSLAEDIWAEELVADVFRNFADLFDLPSSEYDDGADLVSTESIWGHLRNTHS